MASPTYTSPTTRAGNELIDENDWNADLTENIKFLHHPPYCLVSRNAAQSVNDSTGTMISWDTEASDSDTMWALSPNPTRVTVPIAGTYSVETIVQFAQDADGYRRVRLVRNGSSFATVFVQPLSVSTTTACLNRTVNLSANDYIEVEVLHTAGAALNVGNAFDISYLCVRWIRGAS